MKGSQSSKLMMISALTSLMAGSVQGLSSAFKLNKINSMDIDLPMMTSIHHGFYGTRISPGTRQRKRRQRASQVRGGGK